MEAIAKFHVENPTNLVTDIELFETPPSELTVGLPCELERDLCE